MRLTEKNITKLCCHKNYEIKALHHEMGEKELNNMLYDFFGILQWKGKSGSYMHSWIIFFTFNHSRYFKDRPYNYLASKKLDLNEWLDQVTKRHHTDILTLYALSVLMDMHLMVHLHNNELWTTLQDKNISHDDMLNRCSVYLAYLGMGIFIELKKMSQSLLLTTGIASSYSYS